MGQLRAAAVAVGCVAVLAGGIVGAAELTHRAEVRAEQERYAQIQESALAKRDGELRAEEDARKRAAKDKAAADAAQAEADAAAEREREAQRAKLSEEFRAVQTEIEPLWTRDQERAPLIYHGESDPAYQAWLERRLGPEEREKLSALSAEAESLRGDMAELGGKTDIRRICQEMYPSYGKGGEHPPGCDS